MTDDIADSLVYAPGSVRYVGTVEPSVSVRTSGVSFVPSMHIVKEDTKQKDLDELARGFRCLLKVLTKE